MKAVIRLNRQQERVLENVLARGPAGVRSLADLVAHALSDYVEQHPDALEPRRTASDDDVRH